MSATARKTARKARVRTVKRSPAKKVAAKAPRGRVGSRLDDLLRETGDYEAVKAIAIKRVIAWQIAEAMRSEGLTKAAMAARMATSRSQLDRLLDPSNEEVTLSTLARAAVALGRDIRLELV